MRVDGNDQTAMQLPNSCYTDLFRLPSNMGSRPRPLGHEQVCLLRARRLAALALAGFEGRLLERAGDLGRPRSGDASEAGRRPGTMEAGAGAGSKRASVAFPFVPTLDAASTHHDPCGLQPPRDPPQPESFGLAGASL